MLSLASLSSSAGDEVVSPAGEVSPDPGHKEEPTPAPPDDLRVRPTLSVHPVVPRSIWARGVHDSVQVNIDVFGDNIPGDAANEPSIAVDPTNPLRMAIGWRQFDTVENSFRQAGRAYTEDGGLTWTNPGVLRPGEFSSDPVLEADASGNFYYFALQPGRGPGDWACYMYASSDGGNTWPQDVYAWGGDKQWLAIDRTGGPGHGNIYCTWSVTAACCGADNFTRSIDGGLTFLPPVAVPLSPRWGTLSVGPDGALYIIGQSNVMDAPLAKSSNAQHAGQEPIFEFDAQVNIGGATRFSVGPNPGGLLGQMWVATDHSDGPSNGNVYVLGSVDPPSGDPLDVMLVRSTDGGVTWSAPIRVNDDPTDNGAWQWFGTLSVAPNGRIDVIWNDTRASPVPNFSELYYAFSLDQGDTWSVNVPVSPAFNHSLGYPQQFKLGDYYDMVSDVGGVSIAYAATFNGEQDVYYLRLGAFDCNGNGIPDVDDIADGTSEDCNENSLPDECEPDCNDNEVADACDILSGFSPDCDDNGRPDECDRDFDGDGLIDGCDPDSDNDGVLNEDDVCDFTPLPDLIEPDGSQIGDVLPDCDVDLADFQVLRICLDRGGPDEPSMGGCVGLFDYDGNGIVDLRDVAGFQLVYDPS